MMNAIVWHARHNPKVSREAVRRFAAVACNPLIFQVRRFLRRLARRFAAVACNLLILLCGGWCGGWVWAPPIPLEREGSFENCLPSLLGGLLQRARSL